MRRIFDRKISDRTMRGYDPEQVKNWLSNVKEIDILKYYYYPPRSKYPADSKSLKSQPVRKVLSLLDQHFSESSNLFVEIQFKIYKSGKHEIILRGINLDGEITKIGVLNFRKSVKRNNYSLPSL